RTTLRNATVRSTSSSRYARASPWSERSISISHCRSRSKSTSCLLLLRRTKAIRYTERRRALGCNERATSCDRQDYGFKSTAHALRFLTDAVNRRLRLHHAWISQDREGHGRL